MKIYKSLIFTLSNLSILTAQDLGNQNDNFIQYYNCYSCDTEFLTYKSNLDCNYNQDKNIEGNNGCDENNSGNKRKTQKETIGDHCLHPDKLDMNKVGKSHKKSLLVECSGYCSTEITADGLYRSCLDDDNISTYFESYKPFFLSTCKQENLEGENCNAENVLNLLDRHFNINKISSDVRFNHRYQTDQIIHLCKADNCNNKYGEDLLKINGVTLKEVTTDDSEKTRIIEKNNENELIGDVADTVTSEQDLALENTENFKSDQQDLEQANTFSGANTKFSLSFLCILVSITIGFSV